VTAAENPLLNPIIDIARRAGEEILDVYNTSFDVETKGDGSPLTQADQRAHNLIVRELSALDPSIPILSEESTGDEQTERFGWSRFWLVDPLDGTKEFVKRNGEFTVNIALIEDNAPVMGVVHVPVSGESYAGTVGKGCVWLDGKGGDRLISTKPYTDGVPVVVASRSHAGGTTATYLENLERHIGAPEVRSMGSSLKICLVASGDAHVYPRLGPTSEWDTAAAHAVVKAAGGEIFAPDGKPLAYNKESVLNPWFFVSGGGDHDWLAYLEGIEIPEKSA